jgi:hypothetical protein
MGIAAAGSLPTCCCCCSQRLKQQQGLEPAQAEAAAAAAKLCLNPLHKLSTPMRMEIFISQAAAPDNNCTSAAAEAAGKPAAAWLLLDLQQLGCFTIRFTSSCWSQAAEAGQVSLLKLKQARFPCRCCRFTFSISFTCCHMSASVQQPI